MITSAKTPDLILCNGRITTLDKVKPVATAVAIHDGRFSAIFNRWLWLGAGGLGVLTLVATLVANAFWHLAGDARLMALNGFFEHLGLIAAMVMATILGGAEPIIGNPALNQNQTEFHQ